MLEPEVDSDIEFRARKLESPSCTRWLGVEPLNQVLKSLLGAVESLMGVAELLIEV